MITADERELIQKIVPEHEPGELDMRQVDELHEYLMGSSTLYRYAYENKLIGVIRMQLKEVESRMGID